MRATTAVTFRMVFQLRAPRPCGIVVAVMACPFRGGRSGGFRSGVGPQPAPPRCASTGVPHIGRTTPTCGTTYLGIDAGPPTPTSSGAAAVLLHEGVELLPLQPARLRMV